MVSSPACSTRVIPRRRRPSHPPARPRPEYVFQGEWQPARIFHHCYEHYHEKHPVLCLNGNVTALACDEMLKLADRIGCPLEVNIFYRTPERMEALFTFIQERQNALGLDVTVFGEHPDGRIPGLKGPRAACHEEGILRSDVILVPLEDGDRCQALVNMGKTVLVIDLNPMSRSAQQATIAIVDELSRTLHNMLEMSLPPVIDEAYQHQANLQSCLSWMAGAFERA